MEIEFTVRIYSKEVQHQYEEYVELCKSINKEPWDLQTWTKRMLLFGSAAHIVANARFANSRLRARANKEVHL